ncbi:MAG: FAD-binding protein, partial [Lachnospiraceae bacterium]|nr:FAD-binding protein [Lachnospiraceae bacterium]
RQWIVMSGNNIDQELLWTFLTRSKEAMDWLLPITEADGLAPRLVDCIYPIAPYKEYYGAHSFPPKGNIRGNYVSKALYEHAKKLGIQCRFNTPVKQLIKDDAGRVCGAYAQGENGIIRINAKYGVVLATGDIGGDEEMCRAYAPDALRTLASEYVPAGCNTGDGHKMALWAGAAMAEEVFPLMMHPQHYAWCNYCSLFVNKNGKRFMNEDIYVQGRATSVMRQPEGYCYSILSGDYAEQVMDSLKYGGGILWGNAGLKYGETLNIATDFLSVERALKEGNALKADTIEGLADLMDVDKDEFLKTFAEYNELCEKGRDTQFGKRKELLYPLKEGPFYAVKIGADLLVVVGGVSIDTKMHALDKNKKPIDGLFAVGDTTGGIYGHEYVTTILGNSHGRALTWGYIAAETISTEKNGL